jgi:3-deoxy-D-manno-octulosonic-acid transferase
MIWLYNALWLLALPGIACRLGARCLLSGKYRHSLKPRLGLGFNVPKNEAAGRIIWIHALSVGEVLSAVPLVAALRAQYPSYTLFFSSTTESGQELARQRLAPLNCHFLYLPLDLWWVVRRIVRAIGAHLFVLVETDLWPNLLWYLEKQRIPIVLVNGRLSDRSFSRYRRIRRFFGPVLGRIDLLCMQSEEDARRMRMLGIEAEKVRVTGNLKFDQPLAQSLSEEQDALTRDFHWPVGRTTWIAGSTHPGEEEIILRVFSRVRQRFSEVSLILAPRNPERFAEVASLTEQAGWRTVRRSQLSRQFYKGSEVDVLILDTLGELAHFYALSTFAFVGGSLVPIGGHNPLEAAQRGLPVAFGPHMENFREIAGILQESGGAFQVADGNSLYERVVEWLTSPNSCRAQGARAQKAVLVHQGAVERNMEVIRHILGSDPLKP